MLRSQFWFLLLMRKNSITQMKKNGWQLNMKKKRCHRNSLEIASFFWLLLLLKVSNKWLWKKKKKERFFFWLNYFCCCCNISIAIYRKYMKIQLNINIRLFVVPSSSVFFVWKKIEMKKTFLFFTFMLIYLKIIIIIIRIRTKQ